MWVRPWRRSARWRIRLRRRRSSIGGLRLITGHRWLTGLRNPVNVKAYQATLREGRVVDQVGILNKDLLVQIWPALMLPVRVRELWENRFPELAARP